MIMSLRNGMRVLWLFNVANNTLLLNIFISSRGLQDVSISMFY